MNSGKVFLYALAFLIASVLIFPPVSIAAGGDKPFKLEQLDQMLAPIALYPDALLAQVLMASTYPLEIVQADRWVKQNGKLRGDALNAALDKMEWDMSVKALVPFPPVLSMMSEQLDWTQKLGDAFLAQQSDVMDTVQKLRARAQAQNNLKSTKEQKVIVEEKVIRIEPADPQVVYVPAYNPTVVYGTWWYPAYPPLYYPPPYYAAPVLATGVAFAAGAAVGAAWCNGWGNWNWGDHTVNVNVNKNVNINNLKNTNINTNKWEHDPAHRKGVAYRDDATRQHYGQKPPGSPDARKDYRGHTDPGGPRTAQQAGPASKPSQAGPKPPASRQTPAGIGSSSPKPAPQTGYREQGRASAGPESRGQASGASGRYGDAGSRESMQSRSTAFEGLGHGGEARAQSDRGNMSRQSAMGNRGGFGGFHGRR